jgi:hypothetical protein
MIKHIVCWTLQEYAEGCSKNENLKKVKEQLEALKERIPCIHSLEIGLNFENSPEAYDIAMYAEFESIDDLHIYQNHPEHQNVIRFLRKVRDKRVVVDYET